MKVGSAETTTDEVFPRFGVANEVALFFESARNITDETIWNVEDDALRLFRPRARSEARSSLVSLALAPC